MILFSRKRDIKLSIWKELAFFTYCTYGQTKTKILSFILMTLENDYQRLFFSCGE